MLEINKAEFITSAVEPKQYPLEDMPYIAFVGKSNVGKSSMINKLTNRRRLAKTSGQPGKTRLINFFKINDAFYLVDLPGYGYARVSQKEKESWGKMIETFLTSVENLAAVIQLVDIRHEPTEDDRIMIDWIRYYNMPLIILATKADKLGKSRIKPRLADIKKTLNLPKEVDVIAFSSETNIGRLELLEAIQGLIK